MIPKISYSAISGNQRKNRNKKAFGCVVHFNTAEGPWKIISPKDPVKTGLALISNIGRKFKKGDLALQKGEHQGIREFATGKTQKLVIKPATGDTFGSLEYGVTDAEGRVVKGTEITTGNHSNPILLKAFLNLMEDLRSVPSAI